MRLALLALGCLALLCGLAACHRAVSPGDGAPVAGIYDVRGWEPSNAAKAVPPDYVGRVELRREGDTYRFDSTLNSQYFYGRGVYRPESGVLAMCFHGSKGELGCSSCKPVPGGMEAVWAYLDEPKGGLGKEVWTLVGQYTGQEAAK